MDVTELCGQSSHDHDPLLFASESSEENRPTASKDLTTFASGRTDRLPQLPPIDSAGFLHNKRPLLQTSRGTDSSKDTHPDFLVKLPLITSRTSPNVQQSPRPNDTEPHGGGTTLEEVIDHCSFVYHELLQLKLTWTNKSIRQCEQCIDTISQSAGRLLQMLHTIEAEQQGVAKRPRSSVADDDVNTPSPSRKVTVIDSSPLSTEYELIRRARNLQETDSPQSYRRRTKKTVVGQRCHSCHTTETPEWRRGPDGARTLCNACGLNYSKLLKKGSLMVQTHPAAIAYSNTIVPAPQRTIRNPTTDTKSSTGQPAPSKSDARLTMSPGDRT